MSTSKMVCSCATRCAFLSLRSRLSATRLRQAIEAGHLVPYRIYKAKTVKTAADDGFSVGRDELDWSAMAPAAKAEFEELFAESDSITVDPRALERKIHDS